MLIFVDRRRRADHLLEWKVRFFTVAAALVLVGMFFEVRWMTGAAIVLLVGAMLLRFLPGHRAALHDEEDDEHDEHDDDDEVHDDDDDGAEASAARDHAGPDDLEEGYDLR